MIPVSLTIKGIYSYQKQTTIDFADLTSAGLFGIFGAVGSGKSTILEAITFALYGETERLNSRDSRSYNMMNLKCGDLLIDFTFFVGDDKNKYRFTTACKRNKKTFTDGGSFERKVYQWHDTVWHPINKSANEILGLSYENFKRTVIIPQGKFQEFLQLKETERVQMLKEIFNLSKFELGPKVNKLTSENNLKISNIDGQMTSLPENDPIVVEEKENEIKLLNTEVDSRNKDLITKQEQLKHFENIQQLFLDLNFKKEQYDKLITKEDLFKQLEKEVEEYELCSTTFKTLFESREKLRKNLEDLNKDYASSKRTANELNAKTLTATDEIESLKGLYNARESLLQKAIEFEKIIRIKELHHLILSNHLRIEKGQELIKAEETNLNNKTEELDKLNKEIKIVEQSIPDPVILSELIIWFQVKGQLEENKLKYQNEEQQAREAIPVIEKRIIQKLQALPHDVQFESVPKSIDVISKYTSQVDEQYQKEIKSLHEQLNHLLLNQKLGEYVQELHDGEACPVCGSTNHPSKISTIDVDEAIKEVRDKITSVEGKRTLIQKVLFDLSGLYSEQSNTIKFHSQKQQQLNEAINQYDNHISAFKSNDYSTNDHGKVQDEMKRYQQQKLKVAGLRNESENIIQSIESYRKNVEKYKVKLDELKSELARSSTEKETLASQLTLLLVEDEISKEEDHLKHSAKELQAKYKEISTRYEDTNIRLQKYNNDLSALNGKLVEVEKQIERDNKELNDLEATLATLIIDSGFVSEENIRQILSKNIDAKVEKEKVQVFKTNLHTATIQLNEATDKVKGQTYKQEVHIAVKDEIEKLQAVIKQQTEELATLRSALALLKEQMSRRQQLELELGQLTLRAENLKVLANLFRSSGFVNYVSSVYLQNLVKVANERFYKMTSQKLQLELTDDNAFLVRDFMNNGQTRSIKTLSGGQTFQAALSLALALADNIQHLTRSAQNFFFLDEGFGSLDKDSLHVVFDTLKNLKKENRIVGVISHVEDLQQEIPVFLKVTNDVEAGSLITKSWNKV